MKRLVLFLLFISFTLTPFAQHRKTSSKKPAVANVQKSKRNSSANKHNNSSNKHSNSANKHNNSSSNHSKAQPQKPQRGNSRQTQQANNRRNNRNQVNNRSQIGHCNQRQASHQEYRYAKTQQIK